MNVQQIKYALDFGCGRGRNTLPLLEQGFHVVAVDHDPDALEILRNKTKKYVDVLTIVQQDIRDYDTDQQFDLVLATFVLHFLPNEDAVAVFRKMTRFLRPQGIIEFAYMLGKGRQVPAEIMKILEHDYVAKEQKVKIIDDPGHPEFPEPHQHKIFFYLGKKK